MIRMSYASETGDISHAFMADIRAQSSDEAALFGALVPYVRDLSMFIDEKMEQRAVNPKDVAFVAKRFAQHVAHGEARRPSEGAAGAVLRAFTREAEQLSARIELNFGQRGAHLRNHPEIQLHSRATHLCSMGILTFAELLRIQPSAFILKGAPTND